ncbi:hypothetical protein BKA61DRAFT_581969 [Leptodontidium sp. MPI-SDFR-AT-0119]|nr:hypothetical protein BKA61DRAFT_581969 [Leptodontidium sp. MPI-SDFR-AT-0119]
MGNFKCFPMGYLVSAYEPILFKNVNCLIKQAKESSRGPKCFHFIFDLKDIPYVMENIMAFDASMDPDHKLPLQVLTMTTKMHIKNELARYLRMSDGKDPKRDAFSLDERLACLKGVLEDLRGMQDLINEAVKGVHGRKPCLEHQNYLYAYSNRMGLLGAEALRVQNLYLAWANNRASGVIPHSVDEYSISQTWEYCNIW